MLDLMVIAICNCY